jgi:hypothetical protein
MDNETLSKDLWQTSNVLTGFSAVQTIAFSYACTKPEFREIINTFWCKLIIASSISFVTIFQSYAVWWCAIQILALYSIKNTNNENVAKYNDIKKLQMIVKHAAIGRIIIIALLLIISGLSLYAPQIGGIPFNKPTTHLNPRNP